MTLQEIAAVTGAAYRTVADYAQRAGWTQNGVHSYWTNDRQQSL